jgi:hypothetical protein
MITPFVREMIDGPTPLHGIDAPTAGTGKGLLAELVARVATGEPINVMSEAKDQEELRKRITAVLLEGRPFALFDNVTRRLAGGPLAALLTAETWSDRLLGVSKMVRLPVRTIWIATGNNLSCLREIARRTVWIRLDAKIERPWARAKFKHDPIRTWAHQHRAELVWALLVLVQHWIIRGRPAFRARTLGSYESWAEVIGGILDTAGIEGFLANIAAFHARADAETAAWSDFIDAWWQTYRDRVVTVADLFPLATEFLLEALGDGLDRAQRTRLGRALAQRIDCIIGGRRLVAASAQDGGGRERKGYSLRGLDSTPDFEADSRLGGPATQVGTEEVAVGAHAYGHAPNIPTSAASEPGRSWGEL